MDQTENFYHELRQLRVAQGISLEDISAKTRINIRFLEALERGEFEVLPKTYIRLFLRSYCQSIGANENDALGQLEELLGEPEEQHAILLEDLSALPSTKPEPAGRVETEIRGPSRMRRDFMAGAGIFLFLIIVTFFARKVYQSPDTTTELAPANTAGNAAIPAPEPTRSPQPETPQRESPGTIPADEAPRPATTPPPVTRSRPVIPEESSIELPEALFTEDRIISHHLERVRLIPPVRLTLMARDNVVIQPISNGQRGPSINLTVAEARIWTIQDDLILRTTAIELLRGDLNGVPINIGQARGLGVLRVTSTGEYEVFAYASP